MIFDVFSMDVPSFSAPRSGELDFREFLSAFRNNPRFLRKVAVATDINVEDLRCLNVED